MDSAPDVANGRIHASLQSSSRNIREKACRHEIPHRKRSCSVVVSDGSTRQRNEGDTGWSVENVDRCPILLGSKGVIIYPFESTFQV